MPEVLGTDINGRTDYTMGVPVLTWDEVLTANIVATITVPANFNKIFFSYDVGSNVYVTYDGSTPTVPSMSGASTQEKNPGQRYVGMNSGVVLKLISASNTNVNIRWGLGNP